MQKNNPSSRAIIKNGLLKGISIGAGIGIGLITTTLFAAAAAMNVFSPGEVISAADLNRNFTMAAPERAVMAFDLADCPEGWTIADGSNGAPDLRGRFIRGLDNMGGTAAGVDPDSATRTLRSEQLDAFQGHRFLNGVGDQVSSLFVYGGTALQMPGIASNDPSSGGNTPTRQGYTSTPVAANDGNPRTSSETRPVNVALIYCMRKN